MQIVSSKIPKEIELRSIIVLFFQICPAKESGNNINHKTRPVEI